MLLPDTPAEGALALAEKLRVSVETLAMPHTQSEAASIPPSQEPSACL